MRCRWRPRRESSPRSGADSGSLADLRHRPGTRVGQQRLDDRLLGVAQIRRVPPHPSGGVERGQSTAPERPGGVGGGALGQGAAHFHVRNSWVEQRSRQSLLHREFRLSTSYLLRQLSPEPIRKRNRLSVPPSSPGRDRPSPCLDAASGSLLCAKGYGRRSTAARSAGAEWNVMQLRRFDNEV